MSFNFFGFGRKRTRKTSRKTVKPAKSLVKLCKKYGVKVTKKSGSKRTYKKTALLKKQCAKKIRSLIKRKSKFGARGSRFGVTPKRRGGSRRVPNSMTPVQKRSFFRRYGGKIALGLAGLTGAAIAGRYAHAAYKGRNSPTDPGARALFDSDVARAKALGNRGIMRTKVAGYQVKEMAPSFLGGYTAEEKALRNNQATMLQRLARRRNMQRALPALHAATAKQAAAKKALYGFGKRRRVQYRKYHFGNGGNPPLNSSMGYEFCSGGGGVLGANSTGLFPSPCMNAAMPMMGSGPAAAFGKRRRRRTTRRRM